MEPEQQPGVITQVYLYTRDGGFVCTLTIPRFQPPVDVIFWGERTFILGPDGSYREGFAYVAVQ